MVSGRQLRRGFSEKIKIKHYSLRNIEFRILQPRVGVRDSVSCQGLKSCEGTHSCVGGSMEPPSDFSGASYIEPIENGTRYYGNSLIARSAVAIYTS